MNEKKYCVYVHTNKTNGKRYVGMTSLAPEIRWRYNGSGYRSQQRFYTDILEYGWDGFTHEVIKQDLSKREAQQLEIDLIKQYESYKEEFGYNKNCKTLRSYNYYTPKVKDKLIHCIELDMTFKTSLAAQAATGVDNSSILKACKGIRYSAGKHPETGQKLHWEYVSV